MHVIGVAADEEGHVSLAAALEQLGARFGTRSVMIEGGAHHSDLGGPTNPVVDPETDTASLKAARQFEMETLYRWSGEVQEERRKAARAADSMPALRF